ncbi:hypothetical protein Hypma_013585 [Hypsizygus marmoreus]|uniref:Uncharacterized protein n=1 Tax=Hypsizygus marmoreus TaxID=39966 RepID=A0A369JFU0_HYPMA|nr:hypothetical protein Hypma_013585 [Hypsizygus marmoreus]
MDDAGMPETRRIAITDNMNACRQRTELARCVYASNGSRSICFIVSHLVNALPNDRGHVLTGREIHRHTPPPPPSTTKATMTKQSEDGRKCKQGHEPRRSSSHGTGRGRGWKRAGEERDKRRQGKERREGRNGMVKR